MRNPITWLAVFVLFFSPCSVQAAIDTPLYEGISGAAVTELQYTLAYEGYFDVEPTGYFGSITKAALMRWQQDHGLQGTGIFGTAEEKQLSLEGTAKPLLSEGTSGTRVSALQNALRRLGFFDEETTGYFGPITKAALLSWQKSQGFTETGYVSALEWQFFNIDQPNITLTYTSDDLQLLARLVEAEAGGESYQGKLAVAAVVINRVKSKSFPSTLSGVIYERNQFEPVTTGYINRITASADSYRAAQAALGGEDPTSGALYFHNPSLSTSTWMLNRPVTLRIGRHVFS